MFQIKDLTVFNDEPRIKDTILGEKAGMGRPRRIRQIIEANLNDLRRYGTVPLVKAHISGGNGAIHSTKEYWLNEGQAIRLCSLLKTEKAQELTHGVITVFIEWKNGNRSQQYYYSDEDKHIIRVTSIKERNDHTTELKKRGAVNPRDFGYITNRLYLGLYDKKAEDLCKIERLPPKSNLRKHWAKADPEKLIDVMFTERNSTRRMVRLDLSGVESLASSNRICGQITKLAISQSVEGIIDE